MHKCMRDNKYPQCAARCLTCSPTLHNRSVLCTLVPTTVSTYHQGDATEDQGTDSDITLLLDLPLRDGSRVRIL